MISLRASSGFSSFSSVPRPSAGFLGSNPALTALCKHHAEGRVHAANSVPREARPTLRLGLQFSHEDIQNVLGFQMLDTGVLPEAREQMASQHQLVAFKCRRLHGHFHLRQPRLCKLL
jgi:hypothetical protein